MTWRLRRAFWNAVDALSKRLSSCRCVTCGARHLNGRDVSLPLCKRCFDDWMRG